MKNFLYIIYGWGWGEMWNPFSILLNFVTRNSLGCNIKEI
ncbi:hypothetical protein [Oceanotoga phage vB_OteS-UFV02]